MAYGDRGDYAGEEEVEWEYSGDNKTGTTRKYVGTEYQDSTKLYGRGFPGIEEKDWLGNPVPLTEEETYINSAWKHMLTVDRPKSFLSAQTQADSEPVYGDRGTYADTSAEHTAPDQEEIDRWDRYADSAEQYMQAARTNRPALQKGNRLLVGQALEDEKNNVGGRGGRAIREVRTA